MEDRALGALSPARRRHLSITTIGAEVTCVEYHRGIGLEKLRGQRMSLAHVAVGRVAFTLVNGEQLHPFVVWRSVCGDLRIQSLADADEGHAPLGFKSARIRSPPGGRRTKTSHYTRDIASVTESQREQLECLLRRQKTIPIASLAGRYHSQ